MTEQKVRNAEVISALTKAGVPRGCWGISTTGTGRATYRDFAADIQGRQVDRLQKTSAYVRYSSHEGMLDVEILAKEMVLAGVPTYYTTFYKLMRDLRVLERHGEEDHHLHRVFAYGVIALPSIPYLEDMAVENQQVYNETIEYLVGHSNEGGILIIGGNPKLTKQLKAGWPSVLERLLMENSKTFEVS